MSNKEQNQTPDAPIDAYSEYLELAEGHRPPHLYQLLEIELFCPHPERIEQAVRRQFRKIKPFEENPDRIIRELIQDVMTHIATAKTILGSAEQKQEYDDRLAKALKIDRDEILRSRTAARPPEHSLTIIAGPTQVGNTLKLLPDKMVSLGADPHTVVCLPSLRMAPKQATIEQEHGRWMLRCAGENLMTLVNDHRCFERRLQDDDVIDLVGYRIRFARIDAREPSRSAIPPPLSLVIRSGPSVADPLMNLLSPASVLIGQCDTSLWQLGGKGVSTHHAKVQADGAFWQLRDLHSEGGTHLNGERIESSILAHRDEIKLGPYEIQVRLRK
ncbi:MAG: FHA domain-containing protein [Planctomycetes bacterium]|nr:FHA domain-containing protein [Planctomycetota bacterium]